MLSKFEEFKRGWKVVLASAAGAGTGISAVTFFSLGAFVEPLKNDLGWTRAEVTAAPLFMTMASVLMGPLTGWLADRHGARPIALISQVLFIIGVACLSLTGPAVWTFYAGYFLIALVGSGTMPITWTRAITGWFFSARGLALGFALMGTGLMAMIAPSLANALIGQFGWRMAYVGLAAVPLLVGFPLALAFFRDPPKAALNADGTPVEDVWGYSFAGAVKTWRFWQMAIGFFVVSMGIGAVSVHSFPLLTDRGIDKSAAAAVAGLLGLSITCGRVMTGFLLDRYFGPRVALILFTLPALACGLLLVAGDNLLLCALSIMLVGLAGGAEFDIAAYFVARYFGRKNYGAIYGLLYTIFVIGSAVTPPIAGAVYDKFKTYDPALMAGVAIFLIAAIFCGTLGAYPKETDNG